LLHERVGDDLRYADVFAAGRSAEQARMATITKDSAKHDFEMCLSEPARQVRRLRTNPFAEHRTMLDARKRDLASQCTDPAPAKWTQCVASLFDVWDDSPRADYEWLLRRRALVSDGTAPVDCSRVSALADLQTHCSSDGRAACLARLDNAVSEMECAFPLFDWVNAREDAAMHSSNCRKRFGILRPSH
jgi:hypothetical protein